MEEIIVPLVFLIVLIAGAIGWDSHQCTVYGQESGRPVKYKSLTCYVQNKNGEWYTIDQVRDTK